MNHGICPRTAGIHNRSAQCLSAEKPCWCAWYRPAIAGVASPKARSMLDSLATITLLGISQLL